MRKGLFKKALSIIISLSLILSNYVFVVDGQDENNQQEQDTTMEVLEETFDRKEIEVNNENIAQIGLMDNYLAVMFTEATHANFRFALYSLTDYKKCLEKTFYTPLKDAMFLKNYIAINTSLGIEVLEVSEDE